jgi:hypothetical protein
MDKRDHVISQSESCAKQGAFVDIRREQFLRPLSSRSSACSGRDGINMTH